MHTDGPASDELNIVWTFTEKALSVIHTLLGRCNLNFSQNVCKIFIETFALASVEFDIVGKFI